MKLRDHIKFLSIPVVLSSGFIYFSRASVMNVAGNGKANCQPLPSTARKEFGIPESSEFVLIRPHSCQSCGFGDKPLLAKIPSTKRQFVCLIDMDAAGDEISRWQSLSQVKVFKRDAVSLPLRKVTLGLYIVKKFSSEACRLEVNQI